ncbi:MAG: tetratricopeptide repeat protein, partial [Saprospiraceae bacterium]|nr:tetratricopeptide repeat protein [Saprospiraceae bacterium]
ALDTRLDENGHRVYRLARMAANARVYDIAIDAYEYIVEQKGASSPYYLESKRRSLITQRHRIVSDYDYTVEDLRKLEAAYHSFLDEIGRNQTTAVIIAELAELEAFYINDLDTAIRLLEEVVSFPGGNSKIKAEAKLDLADFQLMKGEIWEATLLYSQVDKAYKEDLLGQEARFRNAKLSYYNGDFEWAQAQFDILKASTSKLIANDALELSVFIMDNLGLDTTSHPLTEYAQADLLVFQNRFDEAMAKLNVLGNIYPEHGLQDDILYLKAQIYGKQRRYDQAVNMYNQIIEQFPDEIRADNAMFELAQLYEHQLNLPAEAQALYERLFIEHADSTFSIEARKRYRILRGDFEDPIN